MPIGCGHHSLKILRQHRQSSFDFQEPLGLRERVAVCQARPDQFARNTGWRTRDALRALRQLINVRLGQAD